jgi:hypothetical protein
MLSTTSFTTAHNLLQWKPTETLTCRLPKDNAQTTVLRAAGGRADSLREIGVEHGCEQPAQAGVLDDWRGETGAHGVPGGHGGTVRGDG